MSTLLNASDYAALKALYQQTNGVNWANNTGWKNWDFSSPTAPDTDVVKGWFGVTVTDDRITSIVLPKNQLNGTLPQELGNLTTLKTLDLSKNQLSGSIPSQLGNLTSLTTLSLHENQLSGAIPKELGNLANLAFLSLALNNLSGTIPPEIVAPPTLQGILLFGNKLTGAVPQGVTDRIKALAKVNPTINSLDNPPYTEVPASPITLQDTPLELPFTVGDIGVTGNTDPRRIVSFATTDTPALLGLSPIAPGQANQKLTITPKPGLYGSAKITLAVAVIGKDPKTGKIGPLDPSANVFRFTVLPKDGGSTLLNADDYAALKALYQQTDGAGWKDNTGWKDWDFNSVNIPTLNDVAKWQGVVLNGDRVDFLSLTGNQLNGTLPQELGNLTNARALLLSNNQLSGSIPAELGNLSNLAALQLNGNQLSGDVPQSVKTRLSQLPADNYNLDNLPYIVEPVVERTLVQDSSLQLNFTVGDIDKGANADPNTLQLSFKSSNSALIPDANLVAGGTGANRTLTITPVAGQTGSTVVTLTLTDGKETTTKTFRVAVHAPEQPANGTPLNASDYAALKALYTGTDGTNWKDNTGWKDWDFNSAAPPNANVVAGWKGVTVVGDRVKILDLTDNGLKGSIPVEVGNLTALEQLYLNINKLTGAIPTTIGNLANLKELYLCNNELSDTIPAQLGSLANLNTLDLANNSLGGEIPTELYNLNKLTTLDLSENLLYSTDLSKIGGLTNLENLSLFKNLFGGKIPTELGNLTKLKDVDLSSNQFSDEIPLELGDLTNLTNLNLSDNQLTGEIPYELGNLTKLENLDLFNNKLEGEIPVELGNLSALENLDLSGNKLEGEIPVELGNLSTLEFLNLEKNQLVGDIPNELGNLTDLSGLDLSDNYFGGTISGELAKLNQLKNLDLSNNYLEGEVPKALKDYLVQSQADYNLDNAPYIEGVDDQIITQNQVLNLPVTIGDLDTTGNAAPNVLTLSAASDNLTLFPQGSIKVTGTGGNRTLSITPASGQTGTALVNLLVSDGEEEGWSQFTVTVNPGADGGINPPVPQPIGNLTNPAIALPLLENLLNSTDTTLEQLLVGSGFNLVEAKPTKRGLLQGTNQDDVLRASGKIKQINGKAGNDVLIGNNKGDVLAGGAGDDLLIGRRGKDTLIGGKGRDNFVFLSAEGGADTIVDFDPKADQIVLSITGFNGLQAGNLLKKAFHRGSSAAHKSDRIIYNKNNGDLFFDADGKGGANGILFAHVTPGTNLSTRSFTIV
jgi:Leucine-rich repeat (LRR) protein